MMEGSAETYWRRRGSQVASLVNAAWWLQGFLPAFVGLNVGTAGLLLLFRHRRWEVDYLWAGYGAVALVLGGLVLWAASRRFFNAEDGMLRIESFLEMNTRLTAARDGVVGWPEPRPVPQLTFDYAYGALAWPLVISVGFLLAGALVPIPALEVENRVADPSQPPQWAEVESWIEALEESGSVDESALNEMEEKLGELRGQDAQEWYSQSSLEAGENLRDQAAQSIRSLFQSMDVASSVLGAMPEALEAGDSATLEDLSGLLEEALEALELGNLPLNREALDQLKNLGPNGLPQLNQQQMQDLMNRMKEGMKACENCLGPGQLGLGSELMAAEMMRRRIEAGGIQRGPGPAPMSYWQDANLLPVGRTEAVSNPDLDRAVIGDTVGVSVLEQEVDKTEFMGLQGGNAADYSGSGGEAVWRNSLTPEERKILQGYFK